MFEVYAGEYGMIEPSTYMLPGDMSGIYGDMSALMANMRPYW